VKEAYAIVLGGAVDAWCVPDAHERGEAIFVIDHALQDTPERAIKFEHDVSVRSAHWPAWQHVHVFSDDHVPLQHQCD
jgi:hypothetical protein